MSCCRQSRGSRQGQQCESWVRESLVGRCHEKCESSAIWQDDVAF